MLISAEAGKIAFSLFVFIVIAGLTAGMCDELENDYVVGMLVALSIAMILSFTVFIIALIWGV